MKAIKNQGMAKFETIQKIKRMSNEADSNFCFYYMFKDEDKTATRNDNTKSVTGDFLSMGTKSEVIPPNVSDDSESTMYTATPLPSMNEDDLLAKVCKLCF